MSERYDFARQQKEWASPPIDDVGYIPSATLLGYSDDALRSLVDAMCATRYHGARNENNGWRGGMGLDTTAGKRVLDFGCGVGIEALQFAATGNDVLVADIVPANVELAVRVAGLYGHGVRVAPALITDSYPFVEVEPVDVFYCNGVLHHIPYARDVLLRAAELTAPRAGEIRLMVYSDRGWAKYTGTPVPDVDQDVRDNPAFPRFVREFDQVGFYADWYSEKKIRARFGDFLDLVSYRYIHDDDRYCVVVLKPKESGS